MKIIDEGIEILRFTTTDSGNSKAPINKPRRRVYNRKGNDLIFLYSLKDEKRSEATINVTNHTKIENFHNIILICSDMKKTIEMV